MTESSRHCLSADSEEYSGFMIKHNAHILVNWAKLFEVVIKGSAVAGQSVPVTEDKLEREAFLMGMYNVARQQAKIVVEAFDLKGSKRLLDLGGGPGTYAAWFCLKNPELTALVFDLPQSREFAEKILDFLGVRDRVLLCGGNFLEDGLPKGFDVVWLSQVLHGEGPKKAALLVKKGVESLKPGV